MASALPTDHLPGSTLVPHPHISDRKDHYPATKQDSARCADPDLTVRNGCLAFTIYQLSFAVTA